MEHEGGRYATDALSIFQNCHCRSLSLFLAHTHARAHAHTLTFQLHNADFTDTDKQCEGSYHSTEHSNIEEEEEDDKERGEDKKTACVSSESQARGAHVLFQGSVWGEKGDLGRLCLSVLHVLCILSFVMISASAEGGMLASRVQERGWAYRGAEVQLSPRSGPRHPCLTRVLRIRSLCRHTTSHPWTRELAAAAPDGIYTQSVEAARTHTHTHTHTPFTILPALDRQASHRSLCSIYSNTEIKLNHFYNTNI